MLRNLVRLKCAFGNTFSLDRIGSKNQPLKFILKYSTATAGKISIVCSFPLLHEYMSEIQNVCQCLLTWSFLLLPERKRFYQDVTISQGVGKCPSSSNSRFSLLFFQFFFWFYRFHVDGLYEINLDRRKLKTPGGKLFTVPNEALAIAVATEWNAQKDTLKFYTMHLVWHSITGHQGRVLLWFFFLALKPFRT